MTQLIDIKKAGGVLIKDRKCLIARKRGKDYFMAPGGKIEDQETPKQALVRELHEEFGIFVSEDAFQDFGAFTHPVADEPDKTIHMNVFLVQSWEGEPRPSNEIEEIHWVTREETEYLKIASIFAHEVIPRLKSLGLID